MLNRVIKYAFAVLIWSGEYGSYERKNAAFGSAGVGNFVLNAFVNKWMEYVREQEREPGCA